MTPAESLALVRIVRAACPSQKLDEFTPDVWHGLLEDLRFDDCRAGVMALAKRQPFLSPAEIRLEVRRIRTVRIDANNDTATVDADPDDVHAWLLALRQGRRKIADGELPLRPVAQLIAGTARQLPKR